MEITQIKNSKTLEEVLQKQEMILFKHSTRCPVSSNARYEFEKFAKQEDITIELFMIDVIANRDVSQEFAGKTGIRHESPQVCYLKNGKVIVHESHMRITYDRLNEIVNK